MQMIVSYKLYKLLTGLQVDLENSCSAAGSKLRRRKKTLTIQVLFFSLFFMAFLLYMPIGTAVAPQSYRLSIDDCIDKGLGDTYCEVTMRLNSTSTTLYDNGTCSFASSMDLDSFSLSRCGISHPIDCVCWNRYRKDLRLEPNASCGSTRLHLDARRVLDVVHHE